jgi:hypothetical protein
LTSDQALAQARRFAEFPHLISLRDWVTLARHIAPGLPRQEFASLFRAVLAGYAVDALMEVLPDLQDVDLLNATQEALATRADDTLLAAIFARCALEGPDGERTALLGVLQHLRNAALAESLTSAAETARHRGDQELARAAWDGLSLIGSLEACGFLFQEMKQRNPTESSPPDESLGEAISRVINPDALPLLQAMARGLDLGAPVESRIAAIRALGNYELTQVADTLTAITASETDPTLLESALATHRRLATPETPVPEQNEE